MGSWRALVIVAAVLAVILILIARRQEDGVRAVTERAAPEAGAASFPALPAPAADRSADTDATAVGMSSAHVLRGIVRGPMGPLWGAEVVAFDPRTGEEVVRGRSMPGGGFELDLGAHGWVDVRVVPDAETRLMPAELRACDAGARVEVLLEPGPGLVVHVSGFGGVHPSTPLRLLLFREQDWRELETLGVAPGSGPRRARAFRSAPARETVRFDALPEGRYMIEPDHAAWTLAAPAPVSHDAESVSVELVPLLVAEFEVVDLEAGAPVPAFEGVVAAGSGREAAVVPGIDGRLSIRIPALAPVYEEGGGTRFPEVTIRSPGRIEAVRSLAPGLTEGTVHVWSDGPPNLRVVLERVDGSPWPHPVAAWLDRVREPLPLTGGGAGVWMGRAPRGERRMVLRTRAFVLEFDVVVPGSGVTEVRRRLPATGTLRIRTPIPVYDPARLDVLDLSGVDLDGNHWRLVVPLRTPDGSAGDELVVEEVPAGSCMVRGIDSIETIDIPAHGVAILELPAR